MFFFSPWDVILASIDGFSFIVYVLSGLTSQPYVLFFMNLVIFKKCCIFFDSASFSIKLYTLVRRFKCI